LSIFAGVAFYFENYILGAILYQVSYIFDIVDGALARVKNISSKFGAFFDVATDWLKAPILISLLLYIQGNIVVLIIILLLLGVNCCANKYNDMLFYTTKKSITKTSEIATSKIGKYFEYMKSIHIIPLPGIVEFEALILFLYPIFQLNIFLYLGILLLLFNFILKIYIILKKIK
jgi:phosphatidylglycerophosphate synthase